MATNSSGNGLQSALLGYLLVGVVALYAVRRVLVWIAVILAVGYWALGHPDTVMDIAMVGGGVLAATVAVVVVVGLVGVILGFLIVRVGGTEFVKNQFLDSGRDDVDPPGWL